MLQRFIDLYTESFRGLRREVWYLALVLLINRSGAMVIPFLTVYLTSIQGLTLGQAGLVMSCFGVGSLIGSYVGGWLTDRIGFYGIQQVSLIGSAFLFWLLGQMTGIWPLAITILVLSAVVDAFRPANQAAVAHYSRPENLSRSYGLLRLAVNLGFSIGPVMGGLIVAALDYSWLFIVDGATCLGAALAFRLLLPPGRQRTGESATGYQTDGPTAYRDGYYLAFVFCIMLFATAFMQFFGSLPVYLKEIGYTERDIGVLIAVNGLIIVACEMPLVHLLGQRWPALRVIFIGIALTGLSYLLLLGVAHSALLAVMFIIILTVGEILSMPFSSTFAAARAPVKRRGQYMGLLSIGYALAFIIAPSLGLQWAQHFGFSSLWILISGLALTSALGIYWLGRRPAKAVVEPSVPAAVARE